ncbi:mechanosensitive ion channel domain-containing protein [Halochromatium salexigens]|uniref:mechanosensitive ion channel domain-containing protein n=1 Tax=Halochromatium salexigens TaxID=49447 RepID=UPI00191494BF
MAQNESASGTDADAPSEVAVEGAPQADSDAEPSEQAPDTPVENGRQALAFDPALVGLPDLPQPMASPDDFQKTLDLIDVRIAEKTAALEAAMADAAAAEAPAFEAESAADDAEENGLDADADAERGDAGIDDAENTAAPQSVLAARIARLEQRIELLKELRLVVQRNATLAERLGESERELANLQARLETVETEGFSLEPPLQVSLLDQAQAEQALRQSFAEVAVTRAASAERRQAAAEQALTTAIRERRAARDRFTTAEAVDRTVTERDDLAEALERARLRELLARQQLIATERALELARQQGRLAELEQALLAKRIAYLEERVELPRDALEAQLEDLDATEKEMRVQIDTLQRTGDQAEADLYRARQQLADANGNAEQAALEEWVAARQAELAAARTGVDSLVSAIANLEQMDRLWQQRYQLMHDPEALDLAELLRQIIMETTTAIDEKDAIESRLNALRSMQLAQTRRLRDAGHDAVREAMAVRSAAHELAERYGRELLETQEELIALLQGMRPQAEALVEQQNLSLQLLQAQETLANWWEAEVLVIDDQSIRVRELITALAMFLVVLLIVSLIRMGARRALNRRRAKSSTTDAGDLRLALSAIAGNTSQLFVLIAAFFVAMTFSGLASPTVKHWLWNLLIIAFYIQLGIWATAAMADYFNRKRTRKEMHDPSTVTGYGVMMVFIRVGIWITVVVSLLAYFQYPVAGLLGALGVGSVAVGFALQNILGDVFSSMAIILDKPFRVGDFVKAGDTLGVIEYTGVKTTRIRSLSGEQVVLSNSDILSSRIHNYKHFKERRIAFRIGVVYQTPRVLLERIPEMLRAAVDAQPSTRFDRAHFAEYGDFALMFEIVYYVLSPDYGIYMDIQQGINLDIHRRFEEAGIDFAYPTQELILRRGPPLAASAADG